MVDAALILTNSGPKRIPTNRCSAGNACPSTIALLQLGSFCLQRPPDLLEITQACIVDFWKLGIELLQSLDNSGRDDQAGEPLVVGWHDIPGRVWCGCMADHIFIGTHVVVPQLALDHIRHGKLPMLGRVIQSTQQAPQLLLSGDMEKELERDDAVAPEVTLKGCYVLEPLLPDVLGDELGRQFLAFKEIAMDAHCQHLLV